MNKNVKTRIKAAHDAFVKGGRQEPGTCDKQIVGRAVPYKAGRKPKVYGKKS